MLGIENSSPTANSDSLFAHYDKQQRAKAKRAPTNEPTGEPVDGTSIDNITFNRPTHRSNDESTTAMTISKQWRCFLVSLQLLTTSTITSYASIDVDTTVYHSTYVPGGVQSGPDADGSTYAATAVYSAIDHAVLLTGTTYGTSFQSPEQLVQTMERASYGQHHPTPAAASQQEPSCFLSAIALPGRTEAQQEYYSYDQLHSTSDYSNSNADAGDSMFWTRRQEVSAGPSNSAGVCPAVQYFPATQRLVVAGHAEGLQNLQVETDVTAQVTQQQGVLLDVQYDIVDPNKMFHTVGGQTLDDRSMLYPVAITDNDHGNDGENSDLDGVYVLFLSASHDATLLHAAHPKDDGDSFGSDIGYGMGLARFSVQEDTVTSKTVVERFRQEWFAAFDTTASSSQVQLADLMRVDSASELGGPAATTLLLAGSTDGEGPAYGSKTRASSGWDGFITKVEIQLNYDDADNNSTFTMEQAQQHTTTALRFESGRNKNDWVTHMCQDETGASSSHVYVAGTTEGTFPDSIHQNAQGQQTAFLAKVNVATLDVEWVQHVGGTHHKAKVHGTACAVTRNGVWFGGVAQDGTIVDGGSGAQFGGKDIFVAKLLSSSGKIEYLRQFGSDQDDALAARGGLVADAAGNAIVVGNTYGSLFRERGDDEAKVSSGPPTSDVFVFTIAGFDGNTVEFPYATSSLHTKGRRHNGVYFLLLILLGGTTVVALRAYMHAVAPKTTDRSKVSIYLRKFNVEHIDLRHSATGGWHCHYTGRLAKGKMPKDKEHTILFHQENTYDDLLDASNQKRGLLGSPNNGENHLEESESSYSESMDLYNSEFDPLSSLDTQVPASLWGKDIV